MRKSRDKIDFTRAKAKTILSLEPFLPAPLTRVMVANLNNWSQPGEQAKKPSNKALEAICRVLGISVLEYLTADPDEFCTTMLKVCKRKVPKAKIKAEFQAFQEQFDRYEKEAGICHDYYRTALIPMRILDNPRVDRLFTTWRGKYHLFHFSPAEDKKGIITRAILHICGKEEVGPTKRKTKYMCVSVVWADGANELKYKGIIEVGTSQWYFILGSESGHETACIVTFDPNKVGATTSDLYGVLLGCTEKPPHSPTAVNVFITKVPDNDETVPGDLSEESDIAEKIVDFLNIKGGGSVLRAFNPYD